MDRKYKIIYEPYCDIFSYLTEVFVMCGLAEVGLLIFVLSKNMFKEDIIGAMAFILLPVVAVLFLLISVFFLTRYKLEIDYSNNTFKLNKIFKRYSYNLNEISFKKKDIRNSNNGEIIIIVVYVIYNNKRIYKFSELIFGFFNIFNL